MTAATPVDTTPVVTYRRANVIEPAPTDNGRILLEQQADALAAYAAEHGFHIVADYLDEASGLSSSREGLARLLDELAAGPARGVLVYSLDRITRSLDDMTAFVQTLKELGAGLYTVEQGAIDLDTLLRDTPAWLVGSSIDFTEPPPAAEED